MIANVSMRDENESVETTKHEKRKIMQQYPKPKIERNHVKTRVTVK